MEYIKKDAIEQEKKYFSKIEKLDEARERLEKIQSITLENVYFHITETILN